MTFYYSLLIRILRYSIFFSCTPFKIVDIDLKLDLDLNLYTESAAKIFQDMLLNRYLSLKIDCDWAIFLDNLFALSFCMVHSMVNNFGLSFVELKKNNFRFFLLLRGGSIPTLHLKTSNIFFSGPDFWEIYYPHVQERWN